MIPLKSEDDIKVLREANLYVHEVLRQVKEYVEPGLSTLDIDRFVENFCTEKKIRPAFKGLYGFPNAICVSVNEEVVHGIPRRGKILLEGDIVSLDFGIVLNGFYGDAAITIPVGKISDEDKKLIEITERALYRGIDQIQVGQRIGDIGVAVESVVTEAGFSVVREYVGHGIGRKPHESPQVPNFKGSDMGPVMQEGFVLAVEPMVNRGGWKVKVKEDAWTVVTADGSRSAHFEHSVALTKDGPFILSRP
jgi:methionyl aminopeptidase